jgi:hypothetical protein
MSRSQPLSASQKRAEHPSALAAFDLLHLKQHLPLVFAPLPELPPSPKPHYRSAYRYLGWEQLQEVASLQTASAFEVAVRLFDYTQLEPLLAAHLYHPSAKGQVPFHPVSLYLLSLYRREQHLSRPAVLRLLQHQEEGQFLRRYLGFDREFPSESGLRYFEKHITPALQQEINALQIDVLYQAGLLPTQPGSAEKITLSFDGMLHAARSRLRCSSVQAGCYQPAPRPCPAWEKGKQGCDCAARACAHSCRHATPRDPEARFIVYSGRNKRAQHSPNASREERGQKPPRGRMLYGYYSFAGQLLDDPLVHFGINGPAVRRPAPCLCRST